MVICENVTKSFGSFKAVDDLSFQIPSGICFGLLGPNGAGKSTLIKMLYGANIRSSGTMTVLGRDPNVESHIIKKSMGVVTQDNHLEDALTVYENLVVYSQFLGVPKLTRHEKIMSLLTFMKLDHKCHAPVRTLSGGMKRRLVFVRALLGDPEFIILDEPTTGLDPAVRHLLWDKINELKSFGKTILLTTHYMDEAEQLCDHLVIMDQGEIQAEDTPKNMIERYCPGYLAIIESEMGNPVEEVDIWIRQRLSGYQIRALSLEALHQYLKKHQLEPKVIRPSQMEDVFLEVTGRELSQDA
ncbi:MAG: ABC transporter ATP-binding protein [Bdellovibrionales bacterium]|nr:ABC transporter ATP-binding protein [Bdellovibrionales bacterium]